MLKVNGKQYVKSTRKAIEALSKVDSNADGLYKLSVRKGGKHVTLTLFNKDNKPFAAVCNDNGSAFFVTAFPTDEGVRYMFSTTQETEELMDIKGLDYKGQRERAEQVINSALELRNK